MHKHQSFKFFQSFKVFFLLFMILIFAKPVFSQSDETPDQKAKRMEWFKDAKLGIFIHWGIYSVNGIDESWSFYNKYISYDDYLKQLKGFTAAKYNPGQWAELIEESGAKYAVLTTKHHDGVALWDTRLRFECSQKDTCCQGSGWPLVRCFAQRGDQSGSVFFAVRLV